MNDTQPRIYPHVERCRGADDLRHCWHDTDLPYLRHPVRISQVCCWCGIRQTLGEQSDTRGTHGAYLPA